MYKNGYWKWKDELILMMCVNKDNDNRVPSNTTVSTSNSDTIIIQLIQYGIILII